MNAEVPFPTRSMQPNPTQECGYYEVFVANGTTAVPLPEPQTLQTPSSVLGLLLCPPTLVFCPRWAVVWSTVVKVPPVVFARVADVSLVPVFVTPLKSVICIVTEGLWM